MNLETERLLLKPYEINFADEIFEVVKHREIADTMVMIPHPYPREVVDSWISYLQASFEKGNAYEFAVFLKSTDRYIGNCGLVAINHKHRNAEVGYFIDVKEWGNGYATEACEKIIEYGFNEHKLNRIYSRCMVRNGASRRVMEKSGMKWEGRLRQEFLKEDVYEDMDYLSILASEFAKKTQNSMYDEQLQHAIRLRKEKKLEESNKLLVKLADTYPTNATIQYQCAWSFDVLGEEASAIPYYKKAILGDLSKNDLQNAYLGLGSTYRALGDYTLSLAIFEKAIAEFPENEALKVFYAMTLYNIEKYDEAMETLIRSQLKTTHDANILNYKRAISFYSDKLNQTWN